MEGPEFDSGGLAGFFVPYRGMRDIEQDIKGMFWTCLYRVLLVLLNAFRSIVSAFSASKLLLFVRLQPLFLVTFIGKKC